MRNRTTLPMKVARMNSRNFNISISTVNLISVAAVVTGVFSEAASYSSAAILVLAGLTFLVQAHLTMPPTALILTTTVVAFLVGSVSVPTPLLILFSQRKLSNAVANRAST
jgi:hypothetical protein